MAELHEPRVRGAVPALLCALGITLLTLDAVASERPRVTNGGYMQTRTRAGKLVPLPLYHTEVDADVAAMAASVKVTQQFHNPYKQPIEAVYVFPLPQRAAVYDLRIRVGDRREIRGVVKRRATARAIYRRARARGQTAALLEQERPNIFTHSVANIMPGDRIELSLRYVQEMVPEGNRYSFVFPMVVGPRYTGTHNRAARSRSASGWASNSARVPDAARITPRLLKKGMRPGHDIALKLRIDGGVAVQHLRVITHQASVTQKGRTAQIALDPRDAIPNKDFVVRYQLAGQAPTVGLLAQRDQRGGHLLLTVQPKAKMAAGDVAPREHLFVVDNSGSMSGFPLDKARAIVEGCLAKLHPSDTFNIIKFAGSFDRLAPRALPATAANVARGLRFASGMQGGGGTEFLPALQAALTAPRDPARARAVLFITDGYIGYEAQVLRYLRRHGRGSTIFALGIGSSVNRFLIDGMARIGGGAPFYALVAEKAKSVVERLVSTLSRPALTNLQIDWGQLKVSGQAPAHLPDLYGERPVVVAARYQGSGPQTVTVRGRLAGKPFSQQVSVVLPKATDTTGSPAVAYLWARRRIADWMDLHRTDPDKAPAMEKRVTQLALKYNLMSKFTAMVAVDSRIRNKGAPATRVGVPLPLPQGVSSAAAPGGAYITRYPKTQLGGLLGNSSGASYGVGGLGLRGVGRGAGGVAGSVFGAGRASSSEGTIGLGTLGSIGRGGGGGSGVGYGRGSGRLAARRSRVPMIRAGRAVVMGSLDSSMIRRVIRRHINEVRYAYSQALTGNPSLQGRVLLVFTIDGNGRVIAASVDASNTTLADATLHAKLIAIVKRWQFPKVAGGGTVVVRYPFTFHPR